VILRALWPWMKRLRDTGLSFATSPLAR